MSCLPADVTWEGIWLFWLRTRRRVEAICSSGMSEIYLNGWNGLRVVLVREIRRLWSGLEIRLYCWALPFGFE